MVKGEFGKRIIKLIVTFIYSLTILTNTTTKYELNYKIKWLKKF